MASDPIRGKVARILNSRELVLTVGSAAGVVAGMFFDVLDPKGEDIRDPDSDEVLGSIDRPKVRVQVTRVLEKLSVASTYKKTQVNIGGRGLGLRDDFAQMLAPPKYVTKYETLKTTEKTWEDLTEKESYVKIGDPAVQVIDEIDVGSTAGG